MCACDCSCTYVCTCIDTAHQCTCTCTLKTTQFQSNYTRRQLFIPRENELPLRRDSNLRYHADALLAELPRQLSWAGRILNDYYLTIKYMYMYMYMYMYIHVRTCRCTIGTGYATNLLFHVHIPVSPHTCIYISSHMNIRTPAVHVPTYLNIQITYTCTLIR